MASRILLALSAAALLAFTVYKVPSSWLHGYNLDHVSGVWATLALDASEGVLYRPLVSDDGYYGGTRYFPLQIIVHGALIKLFGDPVVTGYAISLACALLLFAGLYVLSVESGATRFYAFVCPLLILATYPVQYALTSTRGDLLAACLSVWGVALTARRRFGVAGALLGLACLTKVTAVYGLAASVAWLLLRRERRVAFHLSLTFAAVVICGLIATQAASGGRFLSVFAACASGGASLSTMLDVPVELFKGAGTGSLAGVSVLVVMLLALLRTELRSLAAFNFVACLGVTVIVFSSPGVGYNHFLEVFASGSVVLAVALTHNRLRLAYLAPALLVVSAFAIKDFAGLYTGPGWGDEHRAVVRSAPRPMLAESPWYSIYAGERPVMLDPFMFRIAAERDPVLRARLFGQLERREFRLIVLIDAAFNQDRARWYAERHFGAGFIEKVKEHYELKPNPGGAEIYLPRPTASGDSSAD